MLRSIGNGCLGALMVTSLLSCFGGSGGSGNGVDARGGVRCTQVAARLRSCGLISAGYFDCSEPDSDRDRCQADCFQDAACDELELFLCSELDSGALDAIAQAPDLAICFAACDDVGDFICPSGEPISSNWVCDGDNDCGDFADEQDCASQQFACSDGLTVPESFVCDDFEDCSNGEDEAGCPTFDCGDGTQIPAGFRCDEGADCVNGADEVGCAVPLCGGVPRNLDSADAASPGVALPSAGTCTDGTKSTDPCPQEGTACAAVGGVAVACCVAGQFAQQVDPMSGRAIVMCQCEQASQGVVVSCGASQF